MSFVCGTGTVLTKMMPIPDTKLTQAGWGVVGCRHSVRSFGVMSRGGGVNDRALAKVAARGWVWTET